MNRIFQWVAIVFAVVAPPWYGYRIAQDILAEDWTANGWLRNPAVYGPMFLVVLVTGVAMAIHIYLKERKKRERAKTGP